MPPTRGSRHWTHHQWRPPIHATPPPNRHFLGAQVLGAASWCCQGTPHRNSLRRAAPQPHFRPRTALALSPPPQCLLRDMPVYPQRVTLAAAMEGSHFAPAERGEGGIGGAGLDGPILGPAVVGRRAASGEGGAKTSLRRRRRRLLRPPLPPHSAPSTAVGRPPAKSPGRAARRCGGRLRGRAASTAAAAAAAATAAATAACMRSFAANGGGDRRLLGRRPRGPRPPAAGNGAPPPPAAAPSGREQWAAVGSAAWRAARGDVGCPCRARGW